MTNYITKYYQIVTTIFFILICVGCAGRSLDARGREELKYSKIVDSEHSERELFADAVNAYDERQFNNCSQVLEVLLNTYPDGEFKEPAKLKLIDAKFYSGNFAEVVKLVDEFMDLYPEARATPYLLTLAGLSYEQTFGGLGRDPTPLLEAKKYYEQVVKDYPDSDYSISAQKSLQKIGEVLVSYQNYLVNYYKKQELLEAAKVRERKKQDLQSKQLPHPNKRVVPEGLPLESMK